jgi:5-methylthioadenosine/S-adenosylhomocysteine deaminase
MTQLTDDDISLIAEKGVHVVHCPESNLKLNSGFCPIGKLINAGVNVALGTDGAASNNDLDMFGEMRTAALVGKAIANDATAIPASTALEMATINGAKALNLEDKIGSLEIGKQADITVINLDHVSTQPVYDPIAQLVYSASRQQVSDVWVAGKQKVENHQLIDIDDVKIKYTAQNWAKKIKQ